MTAYLFLDLETAGLANDAPIFEVACILTRFIGWQFDPLAEYHGVVKWDDSFDDHLNDFVRQMHATSGLLAAMQATDALPLADHDIAIDEMLGCTIGHGNKGSVHLAGSGVSHFDLRRVNDQMPDTAEWLHWRPLDVGQLEEWRKLAGLQVYDDAHPTHAARKTHRADSDIAYHLDEANFYLRRFR